MRRCLLPALLAALLAAVPAPAAVRHGGFGGPGNDVVVARGGGRDLVDRGPGYDRVYADRRDVVRSCEVREAGG